MTYVVKLYTASKITFTMFNTEDKTFLHIGKIITESAFPIEIIVERKQLVKDGVNTLIEIVYHLDVQD